MTYGNLTIESCLSLIRTDAYLRDEDEYDPMDPAHMLAAKRLLGERKYAERLRVWRVARGEAGG